ncbi:hypothetical protein KAJ83_07585 [Marivibrio halodurans]|uniref:Methyltransferase domain-containing protein n=1 Tax=Marivibrio halodurans TaxID=2039722 RepID=A0A8J7V3I2_9PROT|nr:hypothetical protein [Marivibrio halodurans]MBP5856864.1 hypothetical protein [Marivibrio halodurans]
MSAFTNDWLSLREGADSAARERAGLDVALARAVEETVPADRPGPLRVLDLAAGAGNNRRYLAPRLPRDQRWLLVDGDAALLAAAGPVETRVMDLAEDLDTLPLDDVDLVTASAFLDLVSAEWLDRLARLLAAARVPLLHFALTLDVRHGWQPQEPEDAEVADLLHRHMAGDKGFGPALGPAAPEAVADCFARAGYAVEAADSAWRLDPSEGALQQALLDGYAGVAGDMAPARAAVVTDWAARRRAHIAARRSHHVVGHRDHLMRITAEA